MKKVNRFVVTGEWEFVGKGRVLDHDKGESFEAEVTYKSSTPVTSHNEEVKEWEMIIFDGEPTESTSVEYHGTLYDLVLKSGQELKCFSKLEVSEILRTYKDNENEFGLFVQENDQTDSKTFVKFNDISFIRFPEDNGLFSDI